MPYTISVCNWDAVEQRLAKIFTKGHIENFIAIGGRMYSYYISNGLKTSTKILH